VTRWKLAASAAGDLLRAGRYSRRRWGTRQAETYLAELEAKFAVLASNPHAGPARDEIRPGLRSFPHKAHVIYYRIVEDGVRIVRILHARRRVQRFLTSA
jgi:toxin ParE1/3/4